MPQHSHAHEGGGPPTGDEDPKGRPRRWGWNLIALAVLLVGLNVLVVSIIGDGGPKRIRVPYSPVFLTQVDAGNVESISSQGDTLQGQFRQPVTVSGEKSTTFATEVPAFANDNELARLLEEHHVVINAKAPAAGTPFLTTLLLSILPALLLIGVLVWFMRGSTAAARGVGGFGRSSARRVEGNALRVTFADVAGIDEAQAELTQIVSFLRDPDRYRRLGARIPHGVLLTGPPGTGKTLLARALAGEADAPFFSISASEFIEMYVGVGASRVRDLFKQAREAAPAIVFVDELDAIGRSRSSGGGYSGGHDEREQTLNQLLTELDGFDPTIGVIVLAATNRPEILDAALLRPGRFDRRIVLQPPDIAGRRKILAVHTRSVPLADDVDLDSLAAQTPGMAGADLANMINEAALLAATLDHERVTQDDLEASLEKLVLGSERRILLSPEERRRSAYHEAGHAIVGMLTPGADPVRKVTIIPRGMALGVTMSAPEADRFSYDRAYIEGAIRVALGGRVAEELVFDEVSTGAQSDLERVTELARSMVGQWGMSERIGPLVVTTEDGGRVPLMRGEVSEETARIVDEEMRRIVKESLDEVRDLLSEHRAMLDALAAELLERETLDREEIEAVMSGGPMPPNRHIIVPSYAEKRRDQKDKKKGSIFQPRPREVPSAG